MMMMMMAICQAIYAEGLLRPHRCRMQSVVVQFCVLLSICQYFKCKDAESDNLPTHCLYVGTTLAPKSGVSLSSLNYPNNRSISIQFLISQRNGSISFLYPETSKGTAMGRDYN